MGLLETVFKHSGSILQMLGISGMEKQQAEDVAPSPVQESVKEDKGKENEEDKEKEVEKEEQKEEVEEKKEAVEDKKEEAEKEEEPEKKEEVEKKEEEAEKKQEEAEKKEEATEKEEAKEAPASNGGGQQINEGMVTFDNILGDLNFGEGTGGLVGALMSKGGTHVDMARGMALSSGEQKKQSGFGGFIKSLLPTLIPIGLELVKGYVANKYAKGNGQKAATSQDKAGEDVSAKEVKEQDVEKALENPQEIKKDKIEKAVADNKEVDKSEGKSDDVAEAVSDAVDNVKA